MDIPLPTTLRARHLKNAKLYAHRDDLIADLVPRALLPINSQIMEVGVALGDFSLKLIEAIRPSLFVGIDIFKMHDLTLAWGRPIKDIMGSMTHREYYEQRMTKLCSNTDLVIREGNSHDEINRFDEHSFDLVYIDALHTYSEVMQDAQVAKRVCKPTGLLIFNDYTMMNHKNGTKYGIVQVANHMVTDEGWKVVGLALNQQMFCDIAISRSQTSL